MTTKIEINPNLRLGDKSAHLTVVDIADADGPVATGDIVQVFERASGIHGPALVRRVDGDQITLRVDWGHLSA